MVFVSQRFEEFLFESTTRSFWFCPSSLDAVQAVPPERRAHTLAREIALKTSPVAPSEDVAKALQLMQETDAPPLAVAEDGRLLGSISRDDIERELKLTELESTQGHAASRWHRRPTPVHG